MELGVPLQVLKHVVQQQKSRSTALWSARRMDAVSSKQRSQMLVADAVMASYWLSLAKDDSRLEESLRAANIRFEVSFPSNQLLLDETDDDDVTHRRKKSKRETSKKRKKRTELAAMDQESLVESTAGGLTVFEATWVLGDDSILLRTEEVQQLLCQEIYRRRTTELTLNI
jgi:hypothetical protein